MGKAVSLLLAIILLMASISCTSPKVKETKPIIIGSITFTEHIILTEVIKIMIEQNLGYKVEHIPNITSSAVLHKTMMNNEVDISVRYTGTELTGSLESVHSPKDALSAFTIMRQEFSTRFQQRVFEPLGFENTYAFAVRRETALRYNLQNTSDLTKYASKMKLGTDTTWLERSTDGYLAFTNLYGFSFNTTFPMEINLVYKALRDRRLDAALVYSTDPRIRLYDLQILQDDKHFFPPYQAVIVAKNDTLQKYEGLQEELAKLSGVFDQSTIIELNYLVDEQKIPPSQVAREFLKKKQLIK